VHPTIFLSNVADLLAHQTPMLLASGGGMAFVGYHYKRAPRAARIAMLGLSLVFAASLCTAFFDGVLVTQGDAGIVTPAAVTAVSWLTVLARGVGLALVAHAVIIDRPNPEGLAE